MSTLLGSSPKTSMSGYALAVLIAVMGGVLPVLQTGTFTWQQLLYAAAAAAAAAIGRFAQDEVKSQ